MNYREVSKHIVESVESIEKRGCVKMQRKDMIAMVAAVGIGCHMPLPTSAVENPKHWYVENVFPVASPIVDRLNEYCVFNMNLFFDKLKEVWLNRYRILHEPTSRAAFYNLFNWAMMEGYTDRHFSEDEGSLVKALFESNDGNFNIRMIIGVFSSLAEGDNVPNRVE